MKKVGYTIKQQLSLDRISARYNCTQVLSSLGTLGLPSDWVSFTLMSDGKHVLSGGISPEGNTHT